MRAEDSIAQMEATPRGATDWSGTSRYEVVRVIGAGGMGTVYEARDRERKQRVALKTLLRFDPAALFLFKQEFRTLADVHHPNLVRLYELAGEGERVFFSMELVRGTDFLTYVLMPEAASAASVQSSPADIDRLRPALRQLVEGLAALHSAGKLHRDIKPSNVLVSGDGRVVLLDFGVATEVSKAGDDGLGESGQLVGSVHYMAPEQACGEEVTPASDWYSVGVMLFEALVGRVPFTGDGLDVLRMKAALDAPPPSTFVSGIPQDLDELCHALLDQNPSRRPDAAQILRRLGATRMSVRPDHRSTLTGQSPSEVPLVGREAQLGELRAAFDRACAGSAVTVRVSGRAGMGKSVLVQSFLDGLVERRQAVVLRGRVYERESIPYKAVDAVIDALSRHLVGVSDHDSTLAPPAGADALAKLFPVLLRVPSMSRVAERPAVDPQRMRRHAFRALRELVSNLAAKRPLVLHIDDAQWGDADSVALLLELVRQPSAPPFLLLLAHRDEEGENGPFLNELRARWPEGAEVRDVHVGPLELTDAKRLALALLGLQDEAAHQTSEAIARESEGSPFLIEELARSSAGRRLAGGSTRITLDTVVGERLVHLPEASRRLAEIVAVAGSPIPVTTAARAARIDAIDEAVELLATRRFVRAGVRDGREVVEPIHDRIRETILAHLGGVTLRAHHACLADALEASSEAPPEAIATHLFGAGEAHRAATFAEKAAEKASSKLAFDQAARLFARASEAMDDPEDARRLRIRHAEALVLAGRGVEAARVYVRAAEGAAAIERSDLERAAAEQLLMCGHIDEGTNLLRQVLASWGMSLPSSPLSALVQLILYRIALAIRGLRFEERDPGAIRPEDRARIDAMYAVAIGLSIVDVVTSACIQARHMTHALNAGHRFQVMRAASLEASHHSSQGGPETPKERQLFAIVQRLAERSKDSEAHQAFFEAKRGIRLFLRGRWREAREVLDAAYARYPNNRASANSNSYLFSLYSLWFLGDLVELARRKAYMLGDAEQRGDLYTAVNLRASWPALTSLANDDVESVRQNVRQAMSTWSQSGYSVQHWQAMVVESLTEIYVGAGEQAYRRVEKDARPLKRSLLMKAQFVRVGTLYVRALATAASLEGVAPAMRVARCAELRALARRVEREGMPWTAPLASILSAASADTHGDRAGAVAFLKEAVERAERADMSLYAAAARHQLGRALGGEAGDRMLDDSVDVMAAQGVRRPERFAAMLVPGRWRVGPRS
jgi:eukaryotic-like serine/threonine-protein kinase